MTVTFRSPGTTASCPIRKLEGLRHRFISIRRIMSVCEPLRERHAVVGQCPAAGINRIGHL
ncbi:hypothetical protein C3920_08135 [Novacetimonas pomaceti]|uniref:Uncharacterized protein n=1 Tax=Novacetimonas pomaceti TaxID=2021998 RepID=A0ABX5P4J2_9PROT|nr:hypothetical protein C3920_08135 [Novacetimonas pomaceti]